MIPTSRRLEHAAGYLALGLVNQASDELEAIEGMDRLSAEVMSARVDLYVTAKQWDLLLAVSRELARLRPEDEHGWIHWAYALREMNRVAEAKVVLLEAEPMHGKTCAALHHNLACYACLLGDNEEAKRRVMEACRLGGEWQKTAREDPDLKGLWDEPPRK